MRNLWHSRNSIQCPFPQHSTASYCINKIISLRISSFSELSSVLWYYWYVIVWHKNVQPTKNAGIIHNYPIIQKPSKEPSWICRAIPGKQNLKTDISKQWRCKLVLLLHPFNGLFSKTTWVSRYQKDTGSSAIAEGPRDASCQLISCQLPRNSAVRQVVNKSKLWTWRVKVGRCVVNTCTQPWRVQVAFIVL